MAQKHSDRVEQRGPSHPSVWVNTTYFAEGFPYALVNNVVDVLFQSLGANVRLIGLTSLFHLPWNVKFLWAPILDRYSTKRAFLIGAEVVILALVLVLAAIGAPPEFGLLSLVFILLAIASATHDIAIDGYYLEALDEREREAYVGFKAAAFRIAVLSVKGLLLILVGWLAASAGNHVGFRVGWVVAAAVVAALLAYHVTFLPAVERRLAPMATWFTPSRRRAIAGVALTIAALAFVQWRWAVLTDLRDGMVSAIEPIPYFGRLSLEGWIALVLLLAVLGVLASLRRIHTVLARRQSSYARAYIDLLAQPQMGRVLAFIMLFRLGESFLMKMRSPFLLEPGPCHLTLQQIGTIEGTFGTIATLSGTLLGGWLISRRGMRRCVWPLVLAQNVPNLLYAWAGSQPDPAALGVVGLGAIVVGEDFGAGLGTAVFMVYIMRCVDPRHKATHMAVLTAIMSIGFTLAGVASGFIAEAVGFGTYFLLTFCATVPSMLLIPFVPHLDDAPKHGAKGAGTPV